MCSYELAKSTLINSQRNRYCEVVVVGQFETDPGTAKAFPQETFP
jgi:hypothetical protein